MGISSNYWWKYWDNIMEIVEYCINVGGIVEKTDNILHSSLGENWGILEN